ncbi:MAG TPA: hypothetical protein PK466_11570 [Thermotogota bacterium]|nr:hypothetical protein [Thermotogota bacterium]HPR96963.1 hypothetical protein [Thermotogota bacterium]
MKRSIILLLFLLIVSGIAAFAERINLSNGKMIEGYILSINQDTMEIQLSDDSILTVNRNEIVSVDYQVSAVKNEIPTQSVPIASSVSNIVPIQEIYPPVSYPIDIYAGSGLLDPELEARKRIVKYNERKKNPFLASTLGLVFPGCGHFYSEKIGEGFFFLGSRALFGTLIWYGFKTRIDTETGAGVYNDVVVGSVGAVGFTALTLFEVIDAYYASEAYNDNLKLKLGIETLNDDIMPIFGE